MEIRVKCTCECHTNPNIMHIKACCKDGWELPEVEFKDAWKYFKEYFVPNIEDFHVGYEFEANEEIWQKVVVDEHMQLNALKHQIEKNHIRVPYLTKEQIESENWECIMSEYKGDISLENMAYIFNNNYMLGWFFSKNIISIIVKDPAKETDIDGKIIDYVRTPKYTGPCKDINEFRKIIKLLGI